MRGLSRLLARNDRSTGLGPLPAVLPAPSTGAVRPQSTELRWPATRAEPHLASDAGGLRPVRGAWSRLAARPRPRAPSPVPRPPRYPHPRGRCAPRAPPPRAELGPLSVSVPAGAACGRRAGRLPALPAPSPRAHLTSRAGCGAGRAPLRASFCTRGGGTADPPGDAAAGPGEARGAGGWGWGAGEGVGQEKRREAALCRFARPARRCAPGGKAAFPSPPVAVPSIRSASSLARGWGRGRGSGTRAHWDPLAFLATGFEFSVNVGNHSDLRFLIT